MRNELVFMVTLAIVFISVSSAVAQRVFDLGGQVGGMVAPSNGRYLYVSDETNARVIKLDLHSLNFIEITIPSQPGDLALSPDESRLYVAKSGATSMAVINTENWTIERTWDLNGNVPYDIEVTATRVYIAANTGHSAALVIVNAYDGSIIDVHEDNWDSNTRLIEVDPIRKKLYSGVVGWSPSNLCRWDISTDVINRETRCDHGALGSNGQNLTLSPDGNHILFMAGGGNGYGYTVYNTQALSDNFASRDGEYDIGTYPHDMVYQPDGALAYGICGSFYDKSIKILNTQTQVREGTIEPETGGEKLCMNGDGSMLILAGGQNLYIFTLESNYFPPKYDYDGNGTSDIAIFREDSGLWSIRDITRVYFGSSGDELVPGDYDADGTTDIGIFRKSSGLWAIRDVTRTYFGTSTDLAVPLRSNPSSACNIGIFRSASGLWAEKGVTRVYFGAHGDQPVPGDYDCNGTEDIAIFREDSGLWAIRNISRIYFGNSDDEPVPGDYNKSGCWSPGIFRPLSGMWAIRGVTRVYFGVSSDYPVPADYDGSGGDNIGIFRKSSGLWAVYGITRFYYGTNGDIPATR
jgi:DNA-binding beta-propeller fold protein YncE